MKKKGEGERREREEVRRRSGSQTRVSSLREEDSKRRELAAGSTRDRKLSSQTCKI